MSNAIVIQVELLSGRYHAHAWGEAQFAMAGPEWPPSPWRLLRALAAAWFCARPAQFSEQDCGELLEALGRSEAPAIWIPRSAMHEVRYFQPIRVGRADRTAHHDHFAIPEGGRFWFSFKTVLAPHQRELLDTLLRRLRYLGRSESRARLCLVDLDAPPPGVSVAAPRGSSKQSAPIAYRRVLCTAPDFRASDLWALRTGIGNGNNGYPHHLVDTLLDQRMPLPHGTRWIEYEVPEGALVREIPPRRPAPLTVPDVEVAEIRFRLSRRTPIPIRDMVVVARALRDLAVKAFYARSASGEVSPTLSGRGHDGSVARGHQHASYLPRLRQGAMTLGELLVRVPAGRLTRRELDALLGVERLRIDGPGYPITVVPEAVMPQPSTFAPARRWRSATPFLPPLRHRRGRDGMCVEQQAILCAEQACGWRPARVRSLPGPGGFGRISTVLAHEYGAGGRPWRFTRRLGFWLELAFDAPVVLDRSLGADCHFGAGQFVPMPEDEAKG